MALFAESIKFLGSTGKAGLSWYDQVTEHTYGQGTEKASKESKGFDLFKKMVRLLMKTKQDFDISCFD